MTTHEYSPEQLKLKAEAYCAEAERCEYDVLLKLRQWRASDEVTARILAHLYQQDYLNPQRYCRAFVRDKYRLTHWGRQKIIQALRMKQLPTSAIENALNEIETDEYDQILARLLSQKRRSLKASTNYELNTKLIRFALGRGYQMSEILKHLNNEYPEDFSD